MTNYIIQQVLEQHYLTKMSRAETFTMKDGRKVTVDWLSVKSVMKVKKKDWPEIQAKLKEALDYVNSPEYMERLKNAFGMGNWEWSVDGKCLTVHRRGYA